MIPIDDNVVRRQLRDLDEPMTYFGEGPTERRNRLGRFLAILSPEERAKLQIYQEQKIEDKEQDETFYHPGSELLRDIRNRIAAYSLKQSSARLDMAKLNQLDPLTTRLNPQLELIDSIRQIEDCGSFLDDDNSGLKTLTSCNFNSSASLVATSALNGRCKLWSNQPDFSLEPHLTYNGHQGHANFIIFSPKSGTELAPQAANLTSCSMDGSIFMWNLIDQSPVCRLSEPQKWQVFRVRYHPSGQYVASCCSDNSWRFWDLVTESEVLHQKGHSDSVFDIAFHPDGSLAASAGLDSYCRVWDLRIGKSIHMFEGHTKGIRSVDISPNGYHIATGSLDNSVKIWNLRQRKLEHTIPAHTHAVTTVMFEKENGFFLATSSFDKTVKLWSIQTRAPIKTLDAFEHRVSKIDLSTNSEFMVSCHFETIKLWSTKLMDTTT